MSDARPTQPTARSLPPTVVTSLVPRRPVTRDTATSVQGTLALDLRAMPDTASPSPSAPAPTSRTTDVADRELRTWVATFAQALVECVAGHRPVTQLMRWCSREVYRDLERRTRLVQQAATPDGQPLPLRSAVRAKVCSVHVSRPTPVAAEVAVHVRHGQRSRAMALRLDSDGRRWLCTAVELS